MARKQPTQYPKVGGEFPTHETVNYSAHEYPRADVTTNSVEGYSVRSSAA